MFHYRKNYKRKLSYPEPAICSFCPGGDHLPPVHETEHFMVVPNRIFYDVWELKDVTDHLMIIPKRHLSSFAEFTDVEKAEAMTLMGEYETNGYNVYARAVKSGQRTIEHQHTHLIKTHHKLGRGLLNLQKPYIFFKF